MGWKRENAKKNWQSEKKMRNIFIRIFSNYMEQISYRECVWHFLHSHTHTHERWLGCLGRGGFDWIMKINGRTATTCTLYTQTKSWWTSVETETRNEPNRNPNWNRNGHEAAEWRGKRALYRFDFVLFWYIYSLSFFVFVGWKGKCVSFIALSVTFQFL